MPNCKAGDMAIIRKALYGHDGKIVTCLKFLPNQSFSTQDGETIYLDAWETDPPMKFQNQVHTVWPDMCLFPLKKPVDDEIDEMVVLLKNRQKEVSK